MDGEGQVAYFMACSLMLMLSCYMHVSQQVHWSNANQAPCKTLYSTSSMQKGAKGDD